MRSANSRVSSATARAPDTTVAVPAGSSAGSATRTHPGAISERTPKKMIRAALRGALSDRARNDRIHAVTEIVEGQTPSTKS
ncbi:50S ribosomal protein L4, partial [Mycobacterium sp. NAZ190054]|uniref:50S ribosomal protein L4 n=1 Tax=Mycobacterium sp. NAZ190054 TaxID=1747766 RepID=UPI00350EE4D4